VPTFSFAYTPFPIPPSDPFPNGQTAYRPILVAQIVAPSTGKDMTCLVWPDSGADQCVFPLSYALQLGLDPSAMKNHMTGGVGNAANVTYYENIEVRIAVPSGSPVSFTTYAGFTEGLQAQGVGLLGQCGFFETFRVRFDHAGKLFFLET